MGQRASRRSTQEGLHVVSSLLEDRADELRSELEAIESQLLTIRSASSIVASVDDSAFFTRRRAGTFEEELTEAMLAELTKEQPLHRSELMRRVEEAGVHIGGQNPLDTFASYLTRDPRFTSDGAGCWGLVD